MNTLKPKIVIVGGLEQSMSVKGPLAEVDGPIQIVLHPCQSNGARICRGAQITVIEGPFIVRDKHLLNDASLLHETSVEGIGLANSSSVCLFENSYINGTTDLEIDSLVESGGAGGTIMGIAHTQLGRSEIRPVAGLVHV